MKNLFLITVLISSFLVFSDKSLCEQEKPETNTQNSEVFPVDDYANSIFQSMFDFLAKSEEMEVKVVSTYDVLQNNGQLIEFGNNTEWSVKRPDKVRVEIDSWEGDNRTFYFNGKNITYYDSGQNVYATVQKKGNLDQAFDYFTDSLNMPLPLAELFSEKHPFDLKKDVKSSYYLGESTIDGVTCHELAFRFEKTDIQIWIADDSAQPLPKRLVITYKKAEGQPQNKSTFSDWNLSPKLADNIFVFNAPKDANKIIFAPRYNRNENTGM